MRFLTYIISAWHGALSLAGRAEGRTSRTKSVLRQAAAPRTLCFTTADSQIALASLLLQATAPRQSASSTTTYVLLDESEL